MRITVFTPTLSGGGAERVALDLADHFHKAGHKVQIVTTLNSQLPRARSESLAPIVELQSSRVAFSIPSLKRALRDFDTEVMLSFLTHANIVSLVAARTMRVPPAIVVSERMSLASFYARDTSPLDKLAYRLLPHVYPQAARVIAVSSALKEELLAHTRLSPKKIAVIQNGFDQTRLDAARAAPCPHPWLETNQPPTFVGVGRLVPQKGFDVMIRALSILRDKLNARLIIVGEGPDRAMLDQLAQKHSVELHLAGQVSEPLDYVTRAAGFILASRFEGSPNALIEALATHVPIISTDCPTGPREILRDGELGLLVPVDDANALAQAMYSASRLPQRMPWKVPSMDEVAASYLAVLTDALNARA